MNRFAARGALAALLAVAVPGAHAEEPVVARVNGTGISRADFDRSWNFFLQRSGIPQDHADLSGKVDELRQQVLDRLIEEELLYQEASRANRLPEPAQLEEQLAGVRGQFQSEEQYREALKSNGLDDERLRELFRRRLAIEGLVAGEIGTGVEVSEAEVHDFYVGNPESFQRPEQVRARHILVGTEKGDSGETRAAAWKKAKELHGQLAAGADFETLAREHSTCPSAASGGDLGFFARGQMARPFEEAAFALAPGEISEVTETHFGYHIIRLEERREAGVVPEAEVADRIREHLTGQKTGEAVAKRVQALREKAAIEVVPDL